MALIDASNPDSNWHAVLAQWSRLANWTHYQPSERELDLQIKQFLVTLWSEKDWLKAQYPAKSQEVEDFINGSEALSTVADLANTVKHRVLTQRRRSKVEQTDYFGRVEVSSGGSRRLHYLKRADGQHVEIMTVLRAALDELEHFRFKLRA